MAKDGLQKCGFFMNQPHGIHKHHAPEHEQQGYENHELPVLCLVMECLHADNRAERAAHDGQQQQCRFGDAPAFETRPPLVDAVCGKRHHVDGDEIDRNYSNRQTHLYLENMIFSLLNILVSPHTAAAV